MFDFPSKFKASSESESAGVAREFIRSCEKGDRVILNGELGAGKTFFIKAALASIGISNVNSPSFAIVNEYYNQHHFYHFDFYRLKNSTELFDIGWQDYLNDDESIIFIEWGKRFPSVLPAERIEINVSVINGTEREFSFEKFN